MRILIDIELGNDAMQTTSDVVEAIGARLLNPNGVYPYPHAGDLLAHGDWGRFRDLNGNTVGTFKVVTGNPVALLIEATGVLIEAVEHPQSGTVLDNATSAAIDRVEEARRLYLGEVPS